MTTYDDLAQAATALADPTTTPRDLMVIAQTYPSLWVDVAKHPHAYPDLLSWLSSVGDDSVREAVVERGASPEFPSPPPPPADEQPLEEPPMSTEAEEESTVPESDNPSEDSVSASLGAKNSAVSNTMTSDTESSIDFHAPEFPEDSSPITPVNTVPENPTRAVESNPAKPSWASTPQGKKILIGSGAGLLTVILAVVLIVTLVVLPHQRAEEAAAAEQARLEQEHQAAVDAFTKASDDCTQANKTLATAISHAQQTATLDPSTLNDPALIDALNQAIATAQVVKNCVPPTMADDTAAILKQTTDMTAETSSVTTASSSLTDADQSACRSYQTKANQEAAAKAAEDAQQKAEQEAASKAAHTATLTLTDSNGYARDYTIEISDWVRGTDTASLASTWTKFGGKGTMPLVDGTANLKFTQSEAAYVFGKVSVVNATPTFDPTKFTASNPILWAEYDAGSIWGWLNDWGAPTEYSMGKGLVRCIEYSTKTDCSDVSSDALVNPAMQSNSWGPAPFVMALNGALTKTPNNPNGNPDFDTVTLLFGSGTNSVTLTPQKTW